MNRVMMLTTTALLLASAEARAVGVAVIDARITISWRAAPGLWTSLGFTETLTPRADSALNVERYTFATTRAAEIGYRITIREDDIWGFEVFEGEAGFSFFGDHGGFRTLGVAFDASVRMENWTATPLAIRSEFNYHWYTYDDEDYFPDTPPTLSVDQNFEGLLAARYPGPDDCCARVSFGGGVPYGGFGAFVLDIALGRVPANPETETRRIRLRPVEVALVPLPAAAPLLAAALVALAGLGRRRARRA